MILNLNSQPAQKKVDDGERTDPKKGEFSPSSIGYAQCLRKFYFTKVVQLVGTTTSVPLIFGIAMHSGVETFYKSLKINGITIDEVKRNAIQSFVNEWKRGNTVGDAKRNLETGILLLNLYIDRYKHEDSKFETCDVEGAQWVEMPNGTMLLGKLDRIVKLKEQNVVVDTKTTSGYLGQSYFDQFRNHLPTSLYYYLTALLLGSCSYILIDAIHTPVVGPRSTTEQFARQPFLRTDEQIEEALNTYSKMTGYIMDGLSLEKGRKNHFYCNPDRCTDYGGTCPYLGICQHGAGHPSIGTTFEFASKEVEEMFKRDFSL